ncbi:YidC/Oxa1 family membrane protein insertase [Sinanaerobacter sp. ZZT-01]|uniref:YidC/Oxa1 family membrane protein insertase n=1 Tax=Sinanaerobacter sp. ZZT-01 TaxID=3111540 RepID=UPI003A9855CD
MNTVTKFIAIPLGSLLYFLYSFIDNYAITLIVFTVIVRLCLFPLYANQIKHTSKMQDLQPKMTAIQKKYANDKEMMNQKMQELYQEEKFNPMLGCLPMLIQFPIIIGLFALLRNPIAYIDNSSMIMAVHESFLWIPDLSQPDSWILPIAAGITTYFSMSLSQSQSQMTAENPANPMMKMMKYFFPVMIVWMGRSFPAGLAIYWFLGNLIQVFQTIILNKLKKKAKAQKDASKKKGKK